MCLSMASYHFKALEQMIHIVYTWFDTLPPSLYVLRLVVTINYHLFDNSNIHCFIDVKGKYGRIFMSSLIGSSEVSPMAKTISCIKRPDVYF